MNNIIVLIKQVPDLSELKNDIFDKTTGALRRSSLSSIINPLDDEAMSLATKLHRFEGEKGRIVFLSMGPSNTDEILRQCLSKTGDSAVLLTDNKLAGADTHATALALSYAIRKIVNDIFKGNKEYYVFAGAQSLDGDTAQVPAQIAAALNTTLIPYVSDISKNEKGILFQKKTRCGTEYVKLQKRPVLVTVQGYKFKLFSSILRISKRRDDGILKWNSQDISLETSAKDLSRTKVLRIYNPDVPVRKSIKIQTAEELVGIMSKELYENPLSGELGKVNETQIGNPRIDEHEFGDVWVLSEWGDDDYTRLTYELLSQGRILADALRTGLAVITAKPEKSESLEDVRVDRIFRLLGVAQKENGIMEYCRALASTVKKYRPCVFLTGASLNGRIVAPVVAYFCGCGLTADCTGLRIDDYEISGSSGVLRQIRPALGGNVMAEIRSVNSFCQMATVREGVFGITRPERGRGDVYDEQISFSGENTPGFIVVKNKKTDCSLSFDVPVVVSGGRGLQSSVLYRSLIPSLSKAVSKAFRIPVAYAGSRVAVDHHFVEKSRQIGQTGASIAPSIYMAVGISGALQHMIGVKNSGIIIAINKDEKAPIIKQADYYIVGRAESVVPELIEKLNKKAV